MEKTCIVCNQLKPETDMKNVRDDYGTCVECLRKHSRRDFVYFISASLLLVGSLILAMLIL